MKLNHINLAVPNVGDAIHFFETYFDFRCTDVKGENVLAVLKGEDAAFTMVLHSAKGQEIKYPESFHIGFILDYEDDVRAMHEKLTAGGFTIEQQPRKIRDSFGFYFTYQNILIEVGYWLF